MCAAVGIFFSSGARWRAARRFTVRVLHNLGVGQGPVASKVLQELASLAGKLDGYRGERGPHTVPGASTLSWLFLMAPKDPSTCLSHVSPQASPSRWPC